MSPDSLRDTIDSYNERYRKELEFNAYEARVALIKYAKKYVLTALLHDLEAMVDQSDDVLYIQLHDRHEENGLDAYDNLDTISAHWQKRTTTPAIHPSSEIFIHIPISDEASKALTAILSSITSGSSKEDLEKEIAYVIETINIMDIDAINVHHIVHHPSGSKATIKHVTALGSIDYTSFSKDGLAEHFAEFDIYLKHLPDDAEGCQEVLEGENPEMQYVKPDIETDLNYINDIRADLVNMKLVPQKQIFQTQ